MGPRNVHLINFCKVFLSTQKSKNHSQQKTDKQCHPLCSAKRWCLMVVLHWGLAVCGGSFMGGTRGGSKFHEAWSLTNLLGYFKGEKKNLKNYQYKHIKNMNILRMRKEIKLLIFKRPIIKSRKIILWIINWHTFSTLFGCIAFDCLFVWQLFGTITFLYRQ